MKINQLLTESIKRNKKRAAIMKKFRNNVIIDQWGGSYSEDRKDHRVIKLHGVRDAAKVVAEIKKIIDKENIPGVSVEKTTTKHGYNRGTTGVIVRFSKAEYPDESSAEYSLKENIERLQKVRGWDLEIDGDEVILIRDSEIKGHMEIDEWMTLMKKFNKIQRGRN